MLSLVIDASIHGCQGNFELCKAVTAHSCPRWAAAMHMSAAVQTLVVG